MRINIHKNVSFLQSHVRTFSDFSIDARLRECARYFRYCWIMFIYSRRTTKFQRSMWLAWIFLCEYPCHRYAVTNKSKRMILRTINRKQVARLVSWFDQWWRRFRDRHARRMMIGPIKRQSLKTPFKAVSTHNFGITIDRAIAMWNSDVSDENGRFCLSLFDTMDTWGKGGWKGGAWSFEKLDEINERAIVDVEFVWVWMQTVPSTPRTRSWCWGHTWWRRLPRADLQSTKPSGLGRCDYPPISNQPCYPIVYEISRYLETIVIITVVLTNYLYLWLTRAARRTLKFLSIL